MRKCSFTLIEILVVMVLIGLTFGMVALHVPRALRGEKFEQGVERVKSRILLAQEIMLDFQTDVSLVFDEGEGGYTCSIRADKPLPKGIEREINRHQWIEGIEKIVFEHALVGHLVLEFDSTLGTTPKGVLKLEGKEQEALLALKGFPSSVRRSGHVVKEIEAVYPQAILSFI